MFVMSYAEISQSSVQFEDPQWGNPVHANESNVARMYTTPTFTPHCRPVHECESIVHVHHTCRSLPSSSDLLHSRSSMTLNFTRIQCIFSCGTRLSNRTNDAQLQSMHRWNHISSELWAHVVLPFFFVEFSFLFGCCILVLLVL